MPEGRAGDATRGGPVDSAFALANRCIALASVANGGFVAVDGDGYRASGSSSGAARFFFKPTGLD